MDRLDAVHAGRAPTAGTSIDGYWEMRDWRHNYDNGFSEAERLIAEKDDHESTWKTVKEKWDENNKRKERRKGLTLSTNVKLTQTGDFVNGYFEHRDEGDEKLFYKLSGRIDGYIFTADWQEITPGKDFLWFGTMQCLISRGGQGKAMLGRWVGVDSNEREIHCGVWEWRQLKGKDGEPARTWPTEDSEWR